MARRVDDASASATTEEAGVTGSGLAGSADPPPAVPAGATTTRRSARRFQGRPIAIVLGITLVLGTVALTAAAIYGHSIGSVARERFEAAGRR